MFPKPCHMITYTDMFANWQRQNRCLKAKIVRKPMISWLGNSLEEEPHHIPKYFQCHDIATTPSSIQG